jgi:hypothetical protein
MRLRPCSSKFTIADGKIYAARELLKAFSDDGNLRIASGDLRPRPTMRDRATR